MSHSRISILHPRTVRRTDKGWSGNRHDWSYEDILLNIDIGILILDLSSQAIVFRNPSSADILRDHLIPLNFADLVGMFGERAQFSPFSAAGGDPRTIQFNERLIGYSVYLFAEHHVSLFLRDITEQARLESIAQAINTMDNLGFIFSGIRHEIGNPLNSIKMTVSVLKNNLDNFSKETVAAYIDRTRAEISRMEYLLRSLKNFSMFEKAECQALDLGNFLAKFESLATCDLQRNHIALEVFSPANPCTVLADPRGLHQVLLNLVANAADALGNRPRPIVRIFSRQDGNLVWLYIEDNGCGMSDEQQKHLFQPFCTTKPDGNGLGLVITKKLLALMNGSIEIRSTPGEGTSAAISLPLVQAMGPGYP